MTLACMNQNRIQPVVAWRALGRLIADPEQTHEVFTVIRALSGPSLWRSHKRFRNTAVGCKVLANKVDLVDTLNDRDYLATMPNGSLGQRYLTFVTAENTTTDGLIEASIDPETQAPADEIHEEDFSRFAARQRDMHDLWQMLTQYGRDELGEACLLIFAYAQTKNRGVGVICLAGCLKLRGRYGNGVLQAAWRTYRHGNRAQWLSAQDWEHLLTQPVEEVRSDLGISPPILYENLRAQPALAQSHLTIALGSL